MCSKVRLNPGNVERGMSHSVSPGLESVLKKSEEKWGFIWGQKLICFKWCKIWTTATKAETAKESQLNGAWEGRGQSSLKVRLLPLIQRWFSWKQWSKHTLISLSWVIHHHRTFLHFTKFHVNFARVYYINVENQTRQPRHISSNGSSREGHHGLNTQLGGKRDCWDWTKMVRGKEKQIWRVWKCVSVSAFQLCVQRDGLSLWRVFTTSSSLSFIFLFCFFLSLVNADHRL